jgi:hypothetical protein
MSTNEHYLTFRRFNDAEEAEVFTEELSRLGFHAICERDMPIQDPLFVGNGMTWHLVKLPKEDLEQAERALLEKAEHERVDIPAGHYLHGFSDQELMEVLVKPDEWSADDAVLAQALLRQRGKPVSPDAIELIRTSRMEQLREKDPSPKGYIIAGYVFAFLGGLVGLAIGWHINTSKRTLPNGDRVPVYEATDRRHGARIFIIGAVAFAFWCGVRIWSWLA